MSKQQQIGTIAHIEFAAKEVVEKTEIRSIRNPDQLLHSKFYTLPERFIYTVKLGGGFEVRYQENALHAKAVVQYAVGKCVSVRYQARKISFFGEKILINRVNRIP